jgi:hypothetical protein
MRSAADMGPLRVDDRAFFGAAAADGVVVTRFPGFGGRRLAKS